MAEFDDRKLLQITRVLVLLLGTGWFLMGELYSALHVNLLTNLNIPLVTYKTWPFALLMILDIVCLIALQVKIERDNGEILQIQNGPYNLLTLRILAVLLSSNPNYL